MIRRAALLALALAARISAAEETVDLYWPDPLPSRVDQQQTRFDRGGLPVSPGRPVGQTFVPSASPLTRLDLRITNHNDPRPARLRLFEWAGSPSASRARPALFEDVLSLTGPTGARLHSVFPRREVRPGETYYFEIAAPERDLLKVLATAGREDAYPPGRAYAGGRDRSRTDLWFRSFVSGDAGEAVRSRTNEAAGEPAGRRAWRAPRKPEADPTPADYLERFESGVRWRRRGALGSCGRNAQRAAYLQALLYRASCERDRCDEDRARDALALLDLAADRLLCDDPQYAARCRKECAEERKVGSSWTTPAALTLRELKDSPSLGPEERARGLALVTEAAQRFWPRRELGTHNRSLSGALDLQLAAELAPRHAEAGRWRAHADRVWEQLRETAETEEDAGPYSTALFLPAVLDLAEARGETEAFWSDPALRGLVERYLDQTLPLGIFPSYGDSGSFAVSSAPLIRLLEEAARRTRRPEYRWLAGRVFDYVRRHARDDPPRRESLDLHLAELGRAALVADPTLEAQPPAPLREVPAARQESRAPAPRRAAPGEPLGQILQAPGGPLVRLDLRLSGGAPGARARVTLWRWRGDRAATLREPALFGAELELGEPGAPRLHSLDPCVEAAPERAFYVEIEGAGGALRVAAAADGEDAYREGRSWRDGRWHDDGDLWFVAYELAGYGSQLTHRRVATPRPPSAWGEPRQVYDIEEHSVPDKLLLRSGADPEGLHAVFNLLAGYGHGHDEVGARALLVDGGSVLMTQTAFPYWMGGKEQENENAALVHRFWGGRYEEPGRSVEVTRFEESRRATVAWFEHRDAQGFATLQERRIFFVRDGFLWIRDRFTFPRAIRAAAGPIWHADSVVDAGDGQAFDVAYPAPLANVWRFRNPRRSALIYLLPREGQQARAFRDPSRAPPEDCDPDPDLDRVPARCRSSPGWVVQQLWSGSAAAGETHWFDTLILPHGPEQSPREAAAALRVLYRDAERSALELRLGEEIWTLLDNPSPQPLEIPELASDARYALLSRVAGRVDYLRTRDASRLRIGKQEYAWPVRSSVETTGSDTSR